MREFDDVLGGMHPVAANKRPGRKKKDKKKKDKSATGGKATREATTERQSAVKTATEQVKTGKTVPDAVLAATPAEAAPSPVAGRAPVAREEPRKASKSTRPAMSDVLGELERLRTELREQREARAALETRLRDAEARLRQAETHRAVPPAVAAPKPALDDLGIFAPPAPPSAKPAPEEFAALETWLMEAELRSSDAAGAFAKPGGVSVPRVLLEDLSEGELAAKLASTKLAVEAAEARASYNARQVKKLTEELAEARAAQIRSEARIRVLESRIQQAQARTELFGKYVEESPAEPAQESLPWVFEGLEASPALEEEEAAGPDAVSATAAPAGDLATEAIAPSAAETGVQGAEPAYQAPLEESAAVAAEAEGLGLELGPPLEEAPIEEKELLTTAAETEASDELAAALEAWGAEEPKMTPAASGITTESEPSLESRAVSPIAAQVESEADLRAETAREETKAPGLEPVAGLDLEVSPPGKPAEQGPSLADALEGWGQDIEEAELTLTKAESEPAVSVESSSRKAGPGSMAEALGVWGGMQPEAPREEAPEQEAAPPQEKGKKTGKEAMVDALLRFMGPGS